MKKNYFKPEVELVDIMINNAILNMSLPEGEDDMPNETNKHRGEWGNVWAN